MSMSEVMSDIDIRVEFRSTGPDENIRFLVFLHV